MLPAGVRRRLSRRDGRLPAILLGELMAGMALGMVWPAITAPPPPIPQTAMTAVRAPVPLAPLAPAALPIIVHVPKHPPRNPFGVPSGVDVQQVAPAVPPRELPRPAGLPALRPSTGAAPPPVAGEGGEAAPPSLPQSDPGPDLLPGGDDGALLR